jgi:predicted phage terminase large subunit-like protein
VLAVSYSEGLAEKLALDCLKVLQSPWYRECFPATVVSRSRSARTDFETTRGGGRFSTSVGGTLTGRGGDIILIDDPHKPEDGPSEARRKGVLDWYRSTLLSRLNDPVSGPIVLIQQRIHEEDLAGILLEQRGWIHLDLPAIAEEDTVIDLGWRGSHRRSTGDLLHPARLPQDLLDRRREELGSYVFAAQYQQRPAPLEGGILKWRWFQTYRERPARLPGSQIVQSWDTASSADEMNDFSVCTTWHIHNNEAFLLDVFRARLEYPDLRRQIADEANRYRPNTILIEHCASGIQLYQELKRATNLNLVAIRPEVDKTTRLLLSSSVVEGGRVFLPEQAAWLAEFRRELTLFPNGKHDDQVDSLSQFLTWFGRPQQVPLRGTYG